MKSLWTAKKISVLYGLLFCYSSFAVFVTLIVILFFITLNFFSRYAVYHTVVYSRRDEI